MSDKFYIHIRANGTPCRRCDRNGPFGFATAAADQDDGDGTLLIATLGDPIGERRTP